MFRKFAFAAAAIAALGTVSLSASTPAAAWGKGGGFHHFRGPIETLDKLVDAFEEIQRMRI